MANMPMPKSYQQVLAAAAPDLVAAAVHAAAQLVLHLTGDQRLTREERARHAEVLRELLHALRAEEATRAT